MERSQAGSARLVRQSGETQAHSALALRRTNSHYHFAGAAVALTPLRGRRSVTERQMDLGRGLLLYILGVPLPIILLLAIFWR
jgi:hypothetical protein